MQVKKADLPHMIKFLDDLSLSGKQSVARTHLKKAMAEKEEKYNETVILLITEYDAWIDKEQGQFSNANPDLAAALNDLSNQEEEVDTADISFYDDFIKAVQETDQTFSGIEADVYALFFEGA